MNYIQNIEEITFMIEGREINKSNNLIENGINNKDIIYFTNNS